MELTGPISRDYCTIFSAYSIIALVGALFVLVATVYTLVTKRPQKWQYLLLSLLVFGGYLLSYFRERLFYNMCVRSV